MRADRLVSLVLLLRQRGRLTAGVIARELEVSTRTVLRDIEALSTAGVPVYAERGRQGGFALLPGFRTELTGLNDAEALALLTAGSAGAGRALGLGPALSSAVRKVVDALPAERGASVSEAARRLLVEPETDLLPRGRTSSPGNPALAEVRRAVLGGRRLRLHYAATGQPPRWRTVDPVGLVTVRDQVYLLATRSGADRSYRLSRVLGAEVLDEPAVRSDRVDLDQLWRERCARFLADGHLTVQVRVEPRRREALLGTVVAVRAEALEQDGWVRVEVTFQDLWHAEWALWQLGADVEVLAPASVRTALRERAVAVATRHADPVAAHVAPALRPPGERRDPA